MRKLPLLCLLFPLWLQAKELVIGGTLEPPLKFMDDKAQPGGLDVDVVTAIFNKLKIPIKIELTDAGAGGKPAVGLTIDELIRREDRLQYENF